MQFDSIRSSFKILRWGNRVQRPINDAQKKVSGALVLASIKHRDATKKGTTLTHVAWKVKTCSYARGVTVLLCGAIRPTSVVNCDAPHVHCVLRAVNCDIRVLTEFRWRKGFCFVFGMNTSSTFLSGETPSRCRYLFYADEAREYWITAKFTHFQNFIVHNKNFANQVSN